MYFDLTFKHIHIGIFIFSFILNRSDIAQIINLGKQVELSLLLKSLLPQCTANHDLSTLYIIINSKAN